MKMEIKKNDLVIRRKACLQFNFRNKNHTESVNIEIDEMKINELILGR